MLLCATGIWASSSFFLVTSDILELFQTVCNIPIKLQKSDLQLDDDVNTGNKAKVTADIQIHFVR